MRAALLLALAALLGIPASAAAIVGGQTTARDWPHMAGMEYRAPGETAWDFRCGGSLVRPDVILTAAHCVDDTDSGGTLPASGFRFLLGSKKRSSGGERIGAVTVLEHPRYDQSGGESSDVALLKLERSSTLGRPIRVAGAGDASRWQPGAPAVVIGWGAEASGAQTLPDDLREATVPIVSDTDCANAYMLTGLFAGNPDAATNVCAGNRMGGADSCQGDSGGPLHVQDAAGAWILIGTVSYGLGCAYPTQYGVYGEAGGDALRGWIEQNAAALSNAPVPAGAGGGSAQGAPAGSSSRATAGGRARLTLPSRLGSARRARRRGRLNVTLRASTSVRSITVTLRQRGRTVARGTRRTLRAGSGRIVLRVRRGLRAGRATLRVQARDAAGRRLTASRRVTLRR